MTNEALIAQYKKNKNPKTLEQLYLQNTGTIYRIAHILYDRIAKSPTNHSLDLDDLVQYASIAFIEAIPRYNRTKGANFNTFLHRTLFGQLTNYIKNYSLLISIPLNKQNQYFRIETHGEALATPEELKNRALCEKFAYIVDLDQPLSLEDGEVGSFLVDTILSPYPPPDQLYYRMELLDTVFHLMSEYLSERDQDILISSKLHKMTLQFIADKYQLTREGVRQILLKATNLIRSKLERRGYTSQDVVDIFEEDTPPLLQ